MFTGIVESVGKVVGVKEGESGRILVITASFARNLVPGQSVAVDGACLTVCAQGEGSFTVEAGASTLERTIADRYQPGSPVNLERAIRVGDRLNGHWVQGHVDGLGTFLERTSEGNTRFHNFNLPDDVFSVTVPYGSITVNGVSLTVNRLGPGRVCQVAIVPFTWRHTNFSALTPGSPVNVEADLIGKYVRRMMDEGNFPPRRNRVRAL